MKKAAEICNNYKPYCKYSSFLSSSKQKIGFFSNFYFHSIHAWYSAEINSRIFPYFNKELYTCITRPPRRFNHYRETHKPTASKHTYPQPRRGWLINNPGLREAQRPQTGDEHSLHKSTAPEGLTHSSFRKFGWLQIFLKKHVRIVNHPSWTCITCIKRQTKRLKRMRNVITIAAGVTESRGKSHHNKALFLPSLPVRRWIPATGQENTDVSFVQSRT